MKFWDSSGLVPLLVTQEGTDRVKPLAESDPEIVAWWGASAECASAAARLRREGVLTIEDEGLMLGLLDVLRESWVEISPSERVLSGARRLLRVHLLRAADAFQLSAALLWAEGVETRELVTFDERLGVAARLEGFDVLP